MIVRAGTDPEHRRRDLHEVALVQRVLPRMVLNDRGVSDAGPRRGEADRSQFHSALGIRTLSRLVLEHGLVARHDAHVGQRRQLFFCAGLRRRFGLSGGRLLDRSGLRLGRSAGGRRLLLTPARMPRPGPAEGRHFERSATQPLMPHRWRRRAPREATEHRRSPALTTVTSMSAVDVRWSLMSPIPTRDYMTKVI